MGLLNWIRRKRLERQVKSLADQGYHTVRTDKFKDLDLLRQIKGVNVSKHFVTWIKGSKLDMRYTQAWANANLYFDRCATDYSDRGLLYSEYEWHWNPDLIRVHQSFYNVVIMNRKLYFSPDFENHKIV